MNKSTFLGSAAVLGLALLVSSGFLPQPAGATFVDFNLEDVPAERLIANIEKREKAEPAKKAVFEFQLARLYMMMATKGKMEVSVRRPFYYSVTPPASRHFDSQIGYPDGTELDRKSSSFKGVIADTDDLYQDVGFAGVGVLCPNYRQLFGAMPTTDFSQRALRMSIWHYRQSLKLNPANDDAQIGLGWALEQAGENVEAIRIYRGLVAKREMVARQTTNFMGWSEETNRAYEAAGYLRKLLDPLKDQDEIKALSVLPKPDYDSHVETPIVVPLKSKLSFDQVMQNINVSFDLGMGLRTYKNWPTAQAGWLVYDRRGDGSIDNGRKLFGSYTWFVFWDSGFDALAALDDNADGKLSGLELEHLAIWCDANCDGVSQPGEVQPLSTFDVTELSCQAHADSAGILKCEDGITFASGEKRPTYDVILQR